MTARSHNQEDGRLARGRHTQDRIVDAVITLIEEGDPAPTTARIATRAGISTRLVYHHFHDLEQLLDITVDRRIQQVMARLTPAPTTGTLSDRIAGVVAQRSDMLEWVTPVRLAAMRLEPYSPRLREGRDAMLALARAQLATIFATELDPLPPTPRATLLAALDASTSWGAWYHLRTTGLDTTQAAQTMTTALTALLQAPTQPTD